MLLKPILSNSACVLSAIRNIEETDAGYNMFVGTSGVEKHVTGMSSKLFFEGSSIHKINLTDCTMQTKCWCDYQNRARDW